MNSIFRTVETALRLIHSKTIMWRWKSRQAILSAQTPSTEVILSRKHSSSQLVRNGGIVSESSAIGSRIPDDVLNRMSPVSEEFGRYNHYSSGAWMEFETESTDFHVELCESDQVVPEYMSAWAAIGGELLRQGDSDERIGFVCPHSTCSARAQLRVVSKEAAPCKRYRLYLPLFARVEGVRLTTNDGVPFNIVDNSQNQSGRENLHHKVIAFYGSSVTQGCSASSPTGTIPARVSKLCDVDVCNFGFSSSAFGEPEIAKYLSGLPLEGLVIEYDHNADIDYLSKSHLRFYRTFRKNNPNCFVVLMSRTSAGVSISEDEAEKRRAIIEHTFSYALEHGDKQIAYVNGDEVLPDRERWRYFADDRHPNQLGIELIASVLAKALQPRLAKEVFHEL